ncbi:MAG: hypothetical protein VW622_05055, partial [Opitutae bacterium]
MPDFQQNTQFPWGRLFVLFSLIYLMFCVFAAFYADKILFPFPSPPTCREDQVDFYLTTRSGIKVACAHRTPEKANGLVVLYSHGNGEDIGNLMPLLDEVSEKGIEILAYD